MQILNTLRFIVTHPLNRAHKLRSVGRFLRWQIGSRLIPGTVVYGWVNGSKFYVSPGEVGLTGNIYAGLHEFPDMGFLLHVLRGDDLFVDVGANVGSYTILACAATDARGVAFEPIPETYERLSENMRLNQLGDRVIAVNKGVGAVQGYLEFTSSENCTNHALAAGEQRSDSIRVEVTTLDIALAHESASLMKIDVEGFETEVLNGASEVLRNPALHSVIMELNGSGDRYGYDESKILDMMRVYGFATYSYDPLRRALVSLNGKNLRSGNTLFIRNIDLVRERLQSAPRVSVHGREF